MCFRVAAVATVIIVIAVQYIVIYILLKASVGYEDSPSTMRTYFEDHYRVVGFHAGNVHQAMCS